MFKWCSTCAIGALLLSGEVVAQDAQVEESSDAPADSINEWRSFREDELRQLEIRRADAKRYSKFSEEAMVAFDPLVAPVRASTVEFVNAEDKRVCLGIIVDPGGHILTKASDVVAAGDTLLCRFTSGITVAGRVTDIFSPYDLALVKVEATGLTSVRWELGATEEPGTFVVAAGIGETPQSFGVLSVPTRSLNPGFLGVQLASVNDAARVVSVVRGSAALAAGVRPNDVVIAVDDEKVAGREELITRIKQYSPGDRVSLLIGRGGEELSIDVVLGGRADSLPPFEPNRMMLERMNVPLSRNRSGYPSALQHDLPLRPDECGGPLVDLDGNVIAMNIARAGRIRSLAIPAADLVPLLGEVSEGRFSIPDPEALRARLTAAREAVKRARLALAQAEAQEVNVSRALENLKKYRLPRKPQAEEPEIADRSEEGEKNEAPEAESGPETPNVPDASDSNKGDSKSEPLP